MQSSRRKAPEEMAVGAEEGVKRAISNILGVVGRGLMSRLGYGRWK